MTTRVLSDIIPLQLEPSRNRGIGQVTAGMMRALLAYSDREVVHILMGNGHLPCPEPLPATPALNWRLYYGDFPITDYTLEKWRDFQRPYGVYWQKQLAFFRPDIFHIHSPFELTIPLHDAYQGVKTVFTVYDMIPLRFEQRYLREPLLREVYMAVCKLLQRADHMVAISNSARADLVEYLGVDAQRITVVYPGPSDFYRRNARSEIVEHLRRKFQLRDGFVLCTSGYDYRKNLPGILKSYSQLAPSLRRQFPLVIVCHLTPEAESDLREQADGLGIGHQVVLTNYVSDGELIALYHMATVQFYPSIYEGFGMPVLDAMLLGLPVITSNVSALPEVAGDAGLLVDPFDVNQMSDILTQVLESPARREQMRIKGLEQAEKFSWRAAAEAIRQVYLRLTKPIHSTVMVSVQPSKKLRHLALVSPLPPQRSGIADFSASLLKWLREHISVTAFVAPDALHEVRKYVEGAIESITQLPAMVTSGNVDAVFYQIGNSAFHHFQFPYLMQVPGIVELHDGVLQGFLYSLFLAKGDLEGYRREMSYAHDSVGRSHADDLMRNRIALELYQMTANRRIVDNAVGVIIHNLWAANAVLAHNTNIPLQLMMLPVSRQESAARLDASRSRHTLGIAPDQIVIATFGRLVGAKRLDVMVNAFARLAQEVGNIHLYMVGALETDSVIPQLVQKLGVEKAVHITGYVDEARFVEYMAATDVAINLRYPHAGETSATLVRLLNAGVPVIVSDVGPFADFPDACCWKVPVDYAEEETLLAYLRRLVMDNGLRNQMKANAVRYAKATIPTWDSVAEQYLAFIQKALVVEAPFLRTFH